MTAVAGPPLAVTVAKRPKLFAILAIIPARIPKKKYFTINPANPQYNMAAISKGIPVVTVTKLLNTEALLRESGTLFISHLNSVYLITIKISDIMRASIDQIG